MVVYYEAWIASWTLIEANSWSQQTGYRSTGVLLHRAKFLEVAPMFFRQRFLLGDWFYQNHHLTTVVAVFELKRS